MFDAIEEALHEFRNGNPILVVDDESRENEGDIVFPAAAATQSTLNFCAVEGKGLVCIAIDLHTAKRLDLSPVRSNQKDVFHTAFYDSIDAIADFGISTGLINQNYWENSKWYYVNVERGNAADKLNGRNINVSFTNNSNVPIEVMVFIFYSDEITIDVKTGLVTRHKN